MKARLFFPGLILFLVFTFSACSGNSSYNTIENNIVGTWKVEEVKFRRNGAICYNDVTPKFDSYKFVFDTDYSLQFIDVETGENFYGYWYIDEEWVWDPDDEQNEVQTTVVLTIYDETNTNSRTFNWEEMYISRSKIKTKEKRNKGTYKWKLVSI